MGFSSVEFDCPFRVVGGKITAYFVRDVYAPEVWHAEDADIEIQGDGWTALTGYTGQYSYNGAVMHDSEYISEWCNLARDILAEDGIYVMVAVAYWNDEDELDYEGWAVLRKS